MPTKFRASILPEERLTVIRELAEEYGQVAVIGNGVNDATVWATLSLPPALAVAA